jgi:hypothetical protein
MQLCTILPGKIPVGDPGHHSPTLQAYNSAHKNAWALPSQSLPLSRYSHPKQYRFRWSYCLSSNHAKMGWHNSITFIRWNNTDQFHHGFGRFHPAFTTSVVQDLSEVSSPFASSLASTPIEYICWILDYMALDKGYGPLIRIGFKWRVIRVIFPLGSPCDVTQKIRGIDGSSDWGRNKA